MSTAYATRHESTRAVEAEPGQGLEQLPPWRVLLFNDEINDMGYVTETLCRVASLALAQGFVAMLQAHREGVGQVLITHQERAEHIAALLKEAGLASTAEPVDLLPG